MRGLAAGVAAAAVLAVIGTVHTVIAQSGDRTISLFNIHTKETVTVTFKKGGKFVDAGLERVNHALRDHRQNESTRMDPELIDLLWEIHHELGSKEPIHIISGYRSRATNEQLRRTVGGQASESRHILGKAADVHFPDVPVKNLRYSALIRERGGVGYYPTSAIPFVHVDTDRVRSWPRLPRYELALLFPSGVTKHAAADGGPITKDDVRVAQVKHRDLATQIAAFHDERLGGKTAVALNAPPVAPTSFGGGARPQVAQLPAAADPVPQLIEAPKRAAAIARAVTPTFTPPSATDRAKLSELALMASAGPQLVSGPKPATRPQAALSSLTGNTPVAGLAPAAKPQAPAPKVAAVDPGALTGPVEAANDAGRFGFATNWVQAPTFDEEHPDELSYRPFPIAPLLTTTADEPLMTELVHHDVAKTIDMIDQSSSLPPMRFRPGAQTAQMLWSQKFTGEAIGIAKMRDPQTTNPAGLNSRQVRTTQKQ